MKKNNTDFSLSLLGKMCLLLFFIVLNYKGFSADLDKGKDLFKANCASCHNKNMKDKLTGPALGSYAAQWEAYPKEDLYLWIKNSQSLISKGHPRAVELWNEYKPTVMTAFPTLKDEDIENILAYIDGVAAGTYGAPSPDALAQGSGGVKKDESSNALLYAFGILLLILVAVLSFILKSLRQFTGEEKNTDNNQSPIAFLNSKKLYVCAILGMLVLVGFKAVDNGINLGRQQNYQPTQPIKFSHKIHAGDNKIDCNYCHDGARRSKQSIIPATNTCMNCHKAVTKGALTGTSEITKIFVSAGFDPSTGKYIENYDSLNQNEVKDIYKKWISSQYSEANNGSKNDNFVENQWIDISNALTNKDKKDVRGPIEWIRIHNLPDHVYFNHSQHVSIGKIDCKQCHGKIDEMEEVRQYSTLSMGWCIECHRVTDVKFADNPFYDSYVRFHQELKDGKRDKVTVADIGGLECQKCHY